MPPIIKVCGIQNKEEALGAVNAGANTIGMLLGVPEYIEDKIEPETAKEILTSLPDEIRTVMVTHLLEVPEIIEIVKFTGVDAIQLHNEISPEKIEDLKQKISGVELIKAIHVQDEESVKIARVYEKSSDMLLLDTKSGNRIGGTGKTHDWNISEKIVSEVRIPVILAGGLNPENIEEAVKKVKPAGIDANSGLEYEDGTKDFEKIRIFAEAGRLISANL